MRRKMLIDFNKKQVVIEHTISKHQGYPRITIPTAGLQALNWKIGEKLKSTFTKNEIIIRRILKSAERYKQTKHSSKAR